MKVRVKVLLEAIFLLPPKKKKETNNEEADRSCINFFNLNTLFRCLNAAFQNQRSPLPRLPPFFQRIF